MADMIAFGLLAVVLALAAVIDAKTHRIPNALTFSAILAGLVLWTVAGGVRAGVAGAANEGFTALAVALGGYVPFVILFLAGGLGGGDAKLIAAVGALGARWELVVATVIYAFIVMFAMALVTMVRRRIVMRTLRRILTAVMIVAARVKPDMPTDSPKIPFAVAVCVGGMVAGVEFLLHVRLPWTDLGP